MNEPTNREILEATTEFRREILESIGALRTELKGDIAELRAEIQTLDRVQLSRHQELKRELPALIRHVVRDELERARDREVARQ